MRIHSDFEQALEEANAMTGTDRRTPEGNATD